MPVRSVPGFGLLIISSVGPLSGLESSKPTLKASKGCVMTVDREVRNEKDEEKEVDQTTVFRVDMNGKEGFQKVDRNDRKNDQEKNGRQQVKNV